MRADRRRFLSWMSVAGLAIGGGIVLLRGGGYRLPPGVELGALAPWQWVVLDAAGARLLAPERADVGSFADGFVAGLPARDRDDLTALLLYVEHFAPLAAGHGPRFTDLQPREQDDVLQRLETSPVGLLRGGFQALKALAVMAYYRQDAAFAALGYGGPVVRWR